MLNTKQTEKLAAPESSKLAQIPLCPNNTVLLDDGCYPDGSVRRADAGLASRSNGEDRNADGSR
jgi:hypothetical protein